MAIARALVNEPQLVLADEPTGNLDPDLSLEIMNLFRDINAGGTTVLVATHDRELIKWVGPPRRFISSTAGMPTAAPGGRAHERAAATPSRRRWSACGAAGRSALMSIGTIAIAFLTLGGFLLISVNVQRVLDRGSRPPRCRSTCATTSTTTTRAALEPYLKAQPARRGRGVRLEGAARSSGSSADFPELARRRDGVRENPFPASLEVRLRTERGGDGGGRRAGRRSSPGGRASATSATTASGWRA